MQKLFDFGVDGFIEIECDFEFWGGVGILDLIGGET